MDPLNMNDTKMREWVFQVEGETAPGEVMCIVGSCEQLGEWKPERVVPMTINADNADDEIKNNFMNPSSNFHSHQSKSHLLVPSYNDASMNSFASTCETHKSSSNLWSLKLMIPDGVDVTYRYVVCIFVPPNPYEAASTDDKIVVRRWETNLKPRKIACHDCCDGKYRARFGMIPFRKSSYNVASNAISSSSSPQASVSPLQPPAELFQRGWLIHETLVQLKLHGGSALQIWKQKHKNKDLYIKVTPIETSRSSFHEGGALSSRQNSIDMEESTDISETREKRKLWPIVEVAKLNSEECELQWQKQFGILYEDSAFIIFQAQVIDVSTVNLLLYSSISTKSFVLFLLMLQEIVHLR